jgi:hypothetical protein
MGTGEECPVSLKGILAEKEEEQGTDQESDQYSSNRDQYFDS